MLNLHRPEQLAGFLSTSVPRLHSVLRQADTFYEELVLLDPHKPGKERLVVTARGILRRWQALFYERILAPNLERSPYSHGGVTGRSILTNAMPHLGQKFIFTTDVTSFYPSIRREKIFDLFTAFGCSQEVARLCTRLCTYHHRLEQGIVTSPILADQLMRPVDLRIAGVCRKLGLVYTRFVDDLAISGPFDFKDSGVPALIRRALRAHGFRCNSDKDQFGAVAGGALVTKLRLSNGHPDVQRTYVEELERQLKDAASLGEGTFFNGPYFTESQIRGRVQFVCWVNPGRRRQLRSLLGRIDWRQVRQQALHRGLESVVKRLVRSSAASKAPS